MSSPLGGIRFFDHAIPSLQAGTYQIQVSHELPGVAEAILPAQSQTVVVQGPRFSLPTGDIYSLFPPESSSGQFALKLPQVVLTKRALPWERGLIGLPDNLPWMALLVLQEDEVTGGDPKSATRTVSTTVGALLDDPDPNVIRPAIASSEISAAERQQTAESVTVDGVAFQRLLPTAAELPFLAHCREVSADEGDGSGGGVFAVLIANRFPSVQQQSTDQSGRNIVHLVSLEGFETYLGDRPPAIPPGKQVRLFSLASWAFTCLPVDGQTFSGLVANLAVPGSVDPDRLLLQLPVEAPTQVSTPDEVVQDYLARGYVGLDYEVQTGDATFALYRGPLTPQPQARLAKRQPFGTAAAATIYDRRIGAFDLSLAAAWQIGRSLALADETFGTQLLEFRRRGHHLVDMLHEYQSTAGAIGPTVAQQRLQFNLIHETFLQRLQQGLLHSVSAISQGPVGPARPQLRSKAQASADENPATTLGRMLYQPSVQSQLATATADELAPIAQWLARLRLLHDLPFNHLVADPQLLPAESIRFGYLDPNWVEAMLDGALSLGIHTSRDLLYQEQMKGVIRDAMGLQSDPETTPVTGLLIRSALVSGWPGLVISPVQEEMPLTLLRMERVAPDILLCLVQGVPDRVILSEPHHGLQFGADDQGQLNLRHVTGAAVGQEMGKLPLIDPTTLELLAPYRKSATDRVLNLTGLIADLARAVNEGALTPSGLALQMLSAPEQISFK